MEKVELNHVYEIDCLKGMKLIKDNFIDLLITSPPYNIGMEYNSYDDTKDYDKYIEWLKVVFTESYRIMKSGGRVCINIGDQKNGKLTTHCNIIKFMKEIGYLLRQVIIWNKMQAGSRTAWGSWKSPSNPSIITPFEYILLFSKDTHTKEGNKDDITLTDKEFIDWSIGIWNFGPEMKMNDFGHKAMFPKELPKRLIRLLSYKNDIVFDPFCGCGTTCLVAAEEGRRYIGFDSDKEYIETTQKRIKEYTGQMRFYGENLY